MQVINSLNCKSCFIELKTPYYCQKLNVSQDAKKTKFRACTIWLKIIVNWFKILLNLEWGGFYKHESKLQERHFWSITVQYVKWCKWKISLPS